MKRMENSVLIKAREKVGVFWKEQAVFLKNTLVFGLGLCFSNAVLFFSIAPFGPAFAAAVPSPYLAAAMAGTLVGYALNLSATSTMKYVAALVLVFALRKFMIKKEASWGRGVIAALSSLGALLLPTGLLAAYSGFQAYHVVMALAESVLSASAAFFLVRAVEALTRQESLSMLRSTDLISVLLSFGLIVVALNGFMISGFSIGRFLVALLLLVLAQFTKEAGGAIYGLCAGVALSLSDMSLALYIGAWGFGGLIAGVFAPLGRIGVGVGFWIINCIAAIISGSGQLDVMMLLETSAAVVVYLLIPSRLLEHLRPAICSRAGLEPDTVRQSAIFRMQYAGESLREIGRTVELVSKRLGQLQGEDLSDVCTETAHEVCAGCDRNLICWNQQYEDTQDQMNKMFAVLRKGEALTLESMPEEFLRRCYRSKVVGSVMEQKYRSFLRQEGAERRIAAVRSVVADQFDGMGELMGAMAEQYAETEDYDSRQAAEIVAFLEKRGMHPASVLCFADRNGRSHVEVCLSLRAKRRLDLAELALFITDLCECKMELADVSETREHQKLLFLQEAVYAVNFGVKQISHSESRLCGDSYDYFNDDSGCAYVVLSDGMGSGGRAAVDSAMTCGLLMRMLRCGFAFDAALKLVNAALLVKSSDESLATLDVVRLNLFNGQVELFKAGAAPTFVRRNGMTGAIACSSLPVGILKGVCCEKRTLTLGKGDILVQVSDGVIGEDYEWIGSVLELWRDGTAAELAEKIAAEAVRRRIDGHEDDITVTVIVIQ